jgi:hypothetical protein
MAKMQLQFEDFDPIPRRVAGEARPPVTVRSDSEWATVAVTYHLQRCITNAATNLTRLAIEIQARQLPKR